jgi:ribonuclease P protein component
MKKERRIKKSEEFQSMIKNKKHIASNLFVIYYKEKEQEKNRVGISVSKKLGNAVVRNKLKRQVRMMVQECGCLELDMDILILVRKAYLMNTYDINKKGLETLVKKEAKVKDESIKDTLLDMANYAVMTLMWLEKNNK